MVASDDRAEVALGNPSYVWRFGQDRRLALIEKYVPLKDAAIVDVGCGVGTYVRKLRDLSRRVWGVDVEWKRVRSCAGELRSVALGSAEDLPFATASVDVVLLNEVLEHVGDDAKGLREAFRVLRPGGHVVVFVPNRLFPFETHGVYIGKRFVFGNIPLVNWLPDFARNRLAPHARAYTKGGLRRMMTGLGAEVVVNSYVYPGFDNVSARRRRVGGLLRSALYRAERTPLRAFGLSHFLVLRKPAMRMGGEHGN